jgi:hypothetical protein
MPVTGYLSTRSTEDTKHLLGAFRNGLAQSGYVEGQNVSIEYRWALGQYDRLPAMAASLPRGRRGRYRDYSDCVPRRRRSSARGFGGELQSAGGQRLADERVGAQAIQDL